MRNRASTGVLTLAYKGASRAGLLERRWFRGLFLSSYFLYKKWYEDPFHSLAERHPELFAGGDILDIGANIGYTASVFASVCKPPAKIYAFEPDHASFATLSEVIQRQELNGLVEISRMAVGAADGTLEFRHNEEHSADHRVVTARSKFEKPDDPKITTVPVTSVDSFIASRALRNISFVKIDVQGYEPAVCEGMKKTLEAFPGLAVAFEYAPESILEQGFDPAALLQFFRSSGFHLHILTRRGTQPVSEDQTIRHLAARWGYVDLLCSRTPLA
jgi:FkbM family methyltransferase